MTDPRLAQALLDHITADEPPLGLTTHSVILAGRRSRALRLAGYTGGLAAFTGAALLAGSVVLSGAAPPGNAGPQAGSPDAQTCATVTATPVAPGASSAERADRMSCYLLTAVPAALPGATFADNPARGTPFLVAVPDDNGFSATAMVTTKDGEGLVLFAVFDAAAPDDAVWQQQCEGPHAKATCQTGPHGEKIQIFDFGADSNGVHGRTIYLYSGHTQVIAGAHNGPEDGSGQATMPQPPLTVEQLIALASDPELVLFP